MGATTHPAVWGVARDARCKKLIERYAGEGFDSHSVSPIECALSESHSGENPGMCLEESERGLRHGGGRETTAAQICVFVCAWGVKPVGNTTVQRCGCTIGWKCP
uniref:Uncharacterized protein n=1 Tax=Hemiselmis andersenii TaxID=464988 RepID=A0A7S0XST5_HEMAN